MVASNLNLKPLKKAMFFLLTFQASSKSKHSKFNFQIWVFWKIFEEYFLTIQFCLQAIDCLQPFDFLYALKPQVLIICVVLYPLYKTFFIEPIVRVLPVWQSYHFCLSVCLYVHLHVYLAVLVYTSSPIMNGFWGHFVIWILDSWLEFKLGTHSTALTLI